METYFVAFFRAFLLAAIPYMAAEVLQPILVEAWLNKAFPEEWTDGIIVKIQKI